MKRQLSVILFLLVTLFAVLVTADTEFESFHCDEQHYTTRIPVGTSTTFQSGNGLRIWLDEPGYVPNVLIWRRSSDVDDPETYVRETYTAHMKETYGSRLVGTSLSEFVDIGGKRLFGATYIYKGSSGATINQMHLLEVREDGQVEYDARYLNSERELTLAALDAAVRYYQPDDATGATDTAALVEVRCEEQGYTTRMPDGKSTTFQEGNGLRIWLDEPGYVPNVLIWRRNSRLSDPEAYLNTEYPAYMKEKYGSNLLSVTQHKEYAIGGKQLAGTTYIYKGSSGSSINQLHLVEIREDGDVEYNARFIDSERQMTLDALDAAVRYYQPESGGSGKAPAKSGTKDIGSTKATPIVSGIVPVKDSRFTMDLPAKWNYQVSGEFMTFCYRAWDPSSPNRSVFMFLKLEPFLKSQAAKDTYRTLSSSFGGSYSLFADAPVLKTLTLSGVLDAIPDTVAFARKYKNAGAINASIFPDIRNAKIVEKTPSTIPAPDSCTDNSIGRINYEDSQGNACEGLVTAQPVNTMYYDLYGVDGWPCTVYLFMGVTTPVGELAELEPVLTRCLSSFNFTSSYVKTAINLSNEGTRALLNTGRQMDAASSALNRAWEKRQSTYDILSQKTSDSILGYDRLYDSETGEIYRAENGFYDSYNLHRDEYSNPNLQLIDDSSKQYYLSGIDYYITR